ncbi:MAG: metal ABC transporter ATP-binding protein [Chloroflexota bacterium]|nr:MAG: metal ABC transporter ATP-binding protein [Chloroflexota bacterium]
MLYSNSPAHLEIRNLSVSYNNGARRALENISFSVPQGMRVAVVGPNGAGKSTLFKALVGLVPIERGEIFIHDAALGAHKESERLRVAYVPQRKEVDWRFPVSVNDVVMMGRYGALGWFKRPTKRDREAVQRALVEMNISNLANYPIGELSGGQQQRVFLARALAQEPHILLMDEPFTGVDATTQEATLELLNQLKAQGVTLIVSTHDLNLAAARFDRVLLLNHSVIAYGAPAQVFTTENLIRAFGTHAMFVEGTMIVDDCCAGDAPHTLGESPALELIER